MSRVSGYTTDLGPQQGTDSLLNCCHTILQLLRCIARDQRRLDWGPYADGQVVPRIVSMGITPSQVIEQNPRRKVLCFGNAVSGTVLVWPGVHDFLNLVGYQITAGVTSTLIFTEQIHGPIPSMLWYGTSNGGTSRFGIIEVLV